MPTSQQTHLTLSAAFSQLQTMEALVHPNIRLAHGNTGTSILTALALQDGIILLNRFQIVQASLERRGPTSVKSSTFKRETLPQLTAQHGHLTTAMTY